MPAKITAAQTDFNGKSEIGMPCRTALQPPFSFKCAFPCSADQRSFLHGNTSFPSPKPQGHPARQHKPSDIAFHSERKETPPYVQPFHYVRLILLSPLHKRSLLYGGGRGSGFRQKRLRRHLQGQQSLLAGGCSPGGLPPIRQPPAPRGADERIKTKDKLFYFKVMGEKIKRPCVPPLPPIGITSMRR